jgi:4-amino-4-deoxy-L-arabinose transferase-like glycosyltransferase
MVSWRTLALLALVVALWLRFPLARERFFDPDEFQHLHGGYSIHRGMVPHRDYFEHHTPWLHFGLSWLFPVCGTSLTTIFVARYLMLALALVIVWLTFVLGRDLYGADVGLLGALLLSYTLMFVEKSVEIRPDVPAVACWLAGLVALVRGTRSARAFWYLTSGVYLGAALMFTQKALFGLVGVGIALAWTHAYAGSGRPWLERFRFSSLFVLGLAAPVLVTVGWFLSQSALSTFAHDNFVMNAMWKRRFPPFEYIAQLVQQNPFLAALGLAGWTLGVVSLGGRDQVRQGMAVPAAATLTLLIGLFVIPVPYRQYFQFLLPLWAIYAGRILWLAVGTSSPRIVGRSGTWRPWPARRIVKAIGVALGAGILAAALTYSRPALRGSTARFLSLWIVLIAGMPFGWLSLGWQRALALTLVLGLGYRLTPLRWMGLVYEATAVALVAVAYRSRGREVAMALVVTGVLAAPALTLLGGRYERNDGMLREIEYVMAETSPDDTVLTGWHGSGVFRPHAYYYFFLHDELQAMLSERQRGEDVVRALATRRPAMIEYDDAIRALPQVVQDYIARHYEPTGMGPLYRRKP